MSASRLPDARRRGLLARTTPILGLVAIMWLLEFADAATAYPFDAFGIVPRDGDGLIGIAAAPFLHLGFGHLAANTGALLVLGALILLTSPYFWVVTVSVALFGGLGVWITGDPRTIVVGASGLVYGYAAYLVALGIFRRSLKNVAVALLVIVLYGGFVAGVLPGQAGVSWQGHLFGAVVGIVMGRWHAVTAPRRSWRD